jgi:hypothetical protein
MTGLLTNGAPSRLPPPHKCALCGLLQMPDPDYDSLFWECSRVECPERRQVTAQPSDQPHNPAAPAPCGKDA